MQRLLTAIAAAALVSCPAFGISIRKEGERKRAPNFELKDRAGNVVRLSDYAGKVVLLDFWATWCGPCKASIPLFNDLTQKYESAGFTVLGVSMDEEGWRVVEPYMDKMRIAYPIVMGTKRVAYLYGDVESLPLAFLIDRNRRVAAIHTGAPGRKELEKAVRSLLDSEPRTSSAE